MTDESCVDLHKDSPWIAAYVELRNRYTELLLTEPVDVESTRNWLTSQDVAKVRCLIDVDRLLGCVLLYPARKGEVAVFVAEKGRGVGTRLIHLVPEMVSEMGLTSAWAWVRADNPVAGRVFENCGFVPTGAETRTFQGRTVDGRRYVRAFSAEDFSSDGA